MPERSGAYGRLELLTADEAAEILRMPVTTLRDLTRRRAVPHLRIGRSVRYREIDLEEWLDVCRQAVR